MGLLKRYLRMELDTLLQNNIRFQVIGRMGDLPRRRAGRAAARASSARATRTGLLFNIALNYGGRAEITDAVRAPGRRTWSRTARDPAGSIEEHASRPTSTPPASPTPTCSSAPAASCASRNFLLWQIAYAEIWVTDVLWPDFRRRHLLQAIADYQKRERRYGGIAPA